MVKMTRDRISKLRCIACGSTDKRIALLKSGKVSIGFATICCNCGHMHKYVFRNKERSLDEFNIACMLKGSFTINEIKCGSKYAFCPNKQCPYWKGEPTKHTPSKNHHKHNEGEKHHKDRYKNNEKKPVYTPSYVPENNVNKVRKEYL